LLLIATPVAHAQEAVDPNAAVACFVRIDRSGGANVDGPYTRPPFVLLDPATEPQRTAADGTVLEPIKQLVYPKVMLLIARPAIEPALCVLAGAEQSDLKLIGWNDLIWTVKIRNGASAELCTEPNFGGECTTITEDNHNLDAFGGKISSYRVTRSTVTRDSGPEVSSSAPPG
jgi:hypothetical protein